MHRAASLPGRFSSATVPRRRRGSLRWRSELGDERGDVAESVLVFPVFFLFMLVSLQMAMWAHAVQVAQNAAASGDQAARAFGGSAALAVTQAEQFIEVAGGTSDLSNVQVSVSYLPGGMSKVEVSGDAESILPWFSAHVSAVRLGPIQQFRSSG